MTVSRSVKLEEVMRLAEPHYGMFVALAGKLCVVIGAGPVALRKIRKLLEAGARVRVIAPTFLEEVGHLRDAGTIDLVVRPFQSGDTHGAFLTFAATNDRLTNQVIAREVETRGGLVNVADDPSLCTFIVPATWSGRGITAAFTTGGHHPRLAKQMREAMEDDVQNGTSALAKLVNRGRG